MFSKNTVGLLLGMLAASPFILVSVAATNGARTGNYEMSPYIMIYFTPIYFSILMLMAMVFETIAKKINFVVFGFINNILLGASYASIGLILAPDMLNMIALSVANPISVHVLIRWAQPRRVG